MERSLCGSLMPGHVTWEPLHGKGPEKEALEVTQQGSGGHLATRREKQRAKAERNADESQQPPWEKGLRFWGRRARVCASAQPSQQHMGVLAYGWMPSSCVSHNQSVHQ